MTKANRADPETLNFPHERIGSDSKSSGLFQQQPPWWGTAADRMDPYSSARMFFEALAALDYNNTSRSPGSYAQAVQRSSYPDRYDQHMAAAQTYYDRMTSTHPQGDPPMGDPVWLPDVLRAAGLTVHEYPGWRDRGHGDFGNIWGIVCHHTGSFGETPRGIAEHPDLGLASQLYLSRDGEYTICGAGIAWHAGNGAWPGIAANSANQVTIGIEAANDGGGHEGLPHRASWSDAQYDAYVRGVAAILRKIGQPVSHAIGHKEWAGPAQGKWDPGAIDMNIFRTDVQRVIDGGTPAAAEEDELMGIKFVNEDGVEVDAATALKFIDKRSIQNERMLTFIIDQLCGPGVGEQVRDAVARGEGWDQLGKRYVTDAIAVIGEGMKLPGFKDPGK